MKFNYLLHSLASGLFLLVVISACKTAGTDPISVRKCLINGTDYVAPLGMFGSFTLTSAFTYNAGRQLAKITETKIIPGLGNQVDAQNLVYFADRIEAKPTALSITYGVVSETFALNGAVYIAKISTQQLIAGSTTPSISTMSYEYNADGYLNKTTDNNGSYRIYEYKSGNLSTVKGYAQSGNLDYTTTLTYYEDKSPSAAILPGIDANTNLLSAFYTAGLLGKTNKNALKQLVSGVNGEGITDYTYTYDGDGNISSAVAKSTVASTGANPQTRMATTNYTYSCQ